MPEYHPSQTMDFRTAAKRIILGSFPPYAFTRKSEDEPVEHAIRSKHFYGNKVNQFWKWYQELVDPTLEPTAIDRRNESMAKFDIDVADVIYSCERKGQSPNDSDLSKRCYHLNFLDFDRNDIVKLLCTSKGVMNDMFFARPFASEFPDFHEDQSASADLERRLSGTNVAKPLARIFRNGAGKTIEAVALPSPGSPFRSLKTFGFQGGSAREFLHDYLKRSFEWFLE